MKYFLVIFIYMLCSSVVAAQKPTVKEVSVPCNGDADALPGKYTDHTRPKYPSSLRGSGSEKAAMTEQLIAIEKIEEASRKNFRLTGCFARVSFSGGDKRKSGKMGYGYQLGVYQNVCHVTEHIVKTVGEYRTVFRVDVNPTLANGFVPAGGTGEFYLTDKGVRYEIPVDAKDGPNYSRDQMNNPSRISQYISEAMFLTSRSDNYKNKHGDFLKLINGDGFVESYLHGSREDKVSPNSYKWIDRHYLITKPGVPLLVPVSRKQFLEDLLEYFEIEKANFYYNLEAKLKNITGNSSDNAKKSRASMEADKAAYPQLYEAKKEKIKLLLATQKEEWLQKPAVVEYNNTSYDANQRLKDIGKFYEEENEKAAALYVFNPAYFKSNASKPTKPAVIEVQFRYEEGADRGFSERLFANFLKNYNMEALRRMLE